MIENKESFLNHIADKLNRPRIKTEVSKPEWTKQPQWEVFRDLSKDELIDVLEEQCKVIHTTFKRGTKQNLSEILYETIREFGGGPIITAKDKRNSEYGLSPFYDKLISDHIEVHEWDEKKGNENVHFAEQAN